MDIKMNWICIIMLRDNYDVFQLHLYTSFHLFYLKYFLCMILDLDLIWSYIIKINTIKITWQATISIIQITLVVMQYYLFLFCMDMSQSNWVPVKKVHANQLLKSK